MTRSLKTRRGSARTKRTVADIILGQGGLRQVIDAARARHGLTLGDLTVLSIQTDPYRLDTSAGHCNAAWAKAQLERAYKPGKQAHLRGLHYALVIKANVKKPNGEIYRSTHEDWVWLSEVAIKAARWLGYIPFDRFRDRRSPDPVIYRRSRPDDDARVAAELDNIDLDDLEPKPTTAAYSATQAFQFVIYGEKSSLDEVLTPLAIKREADLYIPIGELSETHAHKMAEDAVKDGRPLVVIIVSDCDPSGWQMAISITRKLQALKDLRFPTLRFEVVPAALTPEQVKALNLPESTLKPGEGRAEKWKQAFGIEQTEVDALLTPEHLEANTLHNLVDDVMAFYCDATLETRVRKAETKWLKAAQKAIDETIDHDRLADIRQDAQRVQDEIEDINLNLRDLVEDVELPPINVPEAVEDDRVSRHALVTRFMDWVTATQALIAHKAYRRKAESER